MHVVINDWSTYLMYCENFNGVYNSIMEGKTVRQKCISLQNFSKRHEEILAPNISAPFDLYCLKEKHKFPFTKPVCDPRPCLLIDSIVNEADMIIEHCLPGDYLVKKGIVDQQHITEKKFLTLLILEAIDYAAQKDFTAFKLACLLNIYISTHNYMNMNYWRQPKEIWVFFMEVLIHLTIEDSPDGQGVFSPEESYDVLSHFHTIYMTNLPLVHILVFGTYRLRFVWPFN